MNGTTQVVEPVRRLNLWGRIVMRFAGRSVVAKHSRRSRLFYNMISRLYDWLYLVRVYGYVQSARHLVDEAVQERDRVMDLGCGTGLVTHLAANRAREVVGIDQARGMLLRAKRKGRHLDNVRYVLGDCRALPIAGSFDVILSSFMLVILKERERRGVIQDAYRLLRPGGKLGLLGSQDRMSDEWHTASGWRRLLHRAGFEDVRIIDLNGIFRIVLAQRPSD